ncbi:hypothetical protein PKO51_06530 [Yokenella regensburgei]|uniref:hypothetical protein n=1 Tax=Yokenella regensburgei TaxID=158877 RepID=UPI0027D96D77|nr:hypothetical protein [Yokenella regensburgei]MDQ4429031.1 hypothetical protein [Yokenella regensburgei]
MFENYTEGARFVIFLLAASFCILTATLVFMLFPPAMAVKQYVMIPAEKTVLTLECGDIARGVTSDENGGPGNIRLPERQSSSGFYCLKKTDLSRWSLFDAKESVQPDDGKNQR